MNVAFYTILGGEPFVKPELFDLFKKYNDCYFQVYTNGTLITDKLCQKLVEVGNVSPQISVEGYQELTDARRGKGVYASVMKAMDRLKAHGVLFGLSTCVTSQNVEIVFSDEFVDFMIDKGAVFGFYFLFMPVCGSPDLSLMPTPQQRVFMYERGRNIRANKPLFLVDFWHDAPYVGGCIAGKRYAHINANGDVEP